MISLRFVIGLVLAVCFAVFSTPCEAARWRARGHVALVSQSGITPSQVGSYEGVGVSSASFEDARNRACYWGKRAPLSVQYSQRGGMFYAVVRYN